MYLYVFLYEDNTSIRHPVKIGKRNKKKEGKKKDEKIIYCPPWGDPVEQTAKGAGTFGYPAQRIRDTSGRADRTGACRHSV